MTERPYRPCPQLCYVEADEAEVIFYCAICAGEGHLSPGDPCWHCGGKGWHGVEQNDPYRAPELCPRCLFRTTECAGHGDPSS